AAAREIAAGLVARGIVPGDRVCILAQTCLDWLLSDIGILLAGGVTVPIYPSNTAEQCEYIVRDSGAKVVILQDAVQLETLMALRDHLLTVTAFVQMTGDVAKTATGGNFVLSMDALRFAGRAWLETHAKELDEHAETVAAESMFTIIYTSGTTGNP